MVTTSAPKWLKWQISCFTIKTTCNVPGELHSIWISLIVKSHRLLHNQSSQDIAFGPLAALPQQLSGATSNCDLLQDLESESLGRGPCVWRVGESNGDVGVSVESWGTRGTCCSFCGGSGQRKPLASGQTLMSCCWGYPSYLHRYKVLPGPGMEPGIHSRHVPKGMQEACCSVPHLGLQSLSLVLD